MCKHSEDIKRLINAVKFIIPEMSEFKVNYYAENGSYMTVCFSQGERCVGDFDDVVLSIWFRRAMYRETPFGYAHICLGEYLITTNEKLKEDFEEISECIGEYTISINDERVNKILESLEERQKLSQTTSLFID